MAALEGKEHFRRKGRALEDVADKPSVEQIEVAGQVPDGQGTAGVLCRRGKVSRHVLFNWPQPDVTIWGDDGARNRPESNAQGFAGHYFG